MRSSQHHAPVSSQETPTLASEEANSPASEEAQPASEEANTSASEEPQTMPNRDSGLPSNSEDDALTVFGDNDLDLEGRVIDFSDSLMITSDLQMDLVLPFLKGLQRL